MKGHWSAKCVYCGKQFKLYAWCIKHEGKCPKKPTPWWQKQEKVNG